MKRLRTSIPVVKRIMLQPDADNEKEFLVVLSLMFMTILFRAFFIFHQGFVASLPNFSDDALITFRYAHNIAAGNGFVYNPGEKVMGTTTPLYTLIMSVFSRAGFDLMWASFVLNAVVDCFVVYLIFKILEGKPLVQVLGSVLYLSHPDIIFWSGNGMEMSLFVLLGLLTTWFFITKRFTLAGIMAAFLLICRIDGILLLGAILAVHIVYPFTEFILRFLRGDYQAISVKSLRDCIPFPARFIVALVAVLLPWIIFGLSYFGTIVPQSASAKLLVYSFREISRFQIWKVTVYDMLLAIPVGVAVIVLLRSPKRTLTEPLYRFLLVLTLWVLVQALSFTLAPTAVQIYGWYRVPQHVMFAVLGAFGLARIVEALCKYTRIGCNTLFQVNGPVFLTATIIPFAIYVVVSVAQYGASAGPHSTQMHLSVGLWLNQYAASSDTVLAGNIGYIGYFSGCRILDNNGLVSPETLPLLEADDGRLEGIISVFKPEYLAMDSRAIELVDKGRLQSGYVLMEKFYYRGSYQSPYHIYKRVDE